MGDIHYEHRATAKRHHSELFAEVDSGELPHQVSNLLGYLVDETERLRLECARLRQAMEQSRWVKDPGPDTLNY